VSVLLNIITETNSVMNPEIYLYIFTIIAVLMLEVLEARIKWTSHSNSKNLKILTRERLERFIPSVKGNREQQCNAIEKMGKVELYIMGTI